MPDGSSFPLRCFLKRRQIGIALGFDIRPLVVVKSSGMLMALVPFGIALTSPEFVLCVAFASHTLNFSIKVVIRESLVVARLHLIAGGA